MAACSEYGVRNLIIGGIMRVHRTRRGARQVAVGALASAALIVALSAPVSAGVTKSGTKYCALLPYSHSYSTGFTEHFPPGNGYGAFSNGTIWTVRERNSSSGNGGFWFVETNGSLNDPNTWAGCRPYG